MDSEAKQKLFRKSSGDVKTGLLKCIQTRICRTSIREQDESDHGFLQAGPWTVAAGSDKKPPEEVVEPSISERSKLSLQNRRSVPCPLTLNSMDNRSTKPFIAVRRTQSSPDSCVPPKVPERSPISLGLNPSSPKASPKAFSLNSNNPSIFSPPLLSPRTSCKPLPPIPSEDDLENPPEEIAPPPPVSLDCGSVMYLPADEISPVTKELHRLSKRGYYWGPISRTEAELRLGGKSDGTFLLRNSLDKRYLLSLSFRSLGQTLHARIEYCNERWSFFPRLNDEVFSSAAELIDDAMTRMTVCYSRSKDPDSPTFPVQLTHPVNRFAEVGSLAYLCRFVIRLHIRADYLEQISLPTSIRKFLS